MHARTVSLLFLTVLLAWGDASAAAQYSLPQILEQQRALQADIDAGRAEGLTPRQIGAIRKSQKQVFAVTEGKDSLDALSIEEKVRLENALEQINAQVTGTRLAADAQEVCWRERKTGSTVKVTRCGTQAERDQVRQGARDWMEKADICVPPGCGN